MRVVLLYPPPWKIPVSGHPAYPPGEGAPSGIDPDAALSSDLIQAPYGLLSLAAQAIHAGHQVTVLNISNFPWPAVELLAAHLNADLYGFSCMTANRRGVAMTAELFRRYHPESHITVGGPHVTALPLQTLARCKAIDTVVTGEGEQTFLQMLEQLEDARPVEDLPGLAWRSSAGCHLRPPGAFIGNLDDLVPPANYFRLRTLLTSRGCPMSCTYCCSNLMWGRRLRSHSVEYVLDMIETAVCRQGQRIIAIKDDTFTVQPQRVLAICRGIRSRGLDFMWSCETRADCVDERTLTAMRAAGCMRISLGVESASEKILQNVRKHITPRQVLQATMAAKKVGLQVRYYMMAGNRGETWETFQQSLEFIAAAKPNQFVFSQLHLYPGTDEFGLFERSGAVSNDLFFDRDFLCLTCYAGRPDDAAKITAAVKQLEGTQSYWDYRSADCAAAIDRLPPQPSLHMDLCAAYLREKKPDHAEEQLQQAVDMGYFLPGLVNNHRACIAALRREYKAALAYLETAVRFYPHRVVLKNLERLRVWMEGDRPSTGHPPEMAVGSGFETACVWTQPEFPDPLHLSRQLNAAGHSLRHTTER
jgi:radical SAM superfamily enzyme YgiQ (UPF0313 family)